MNILICIKQVPGTTKVDIDEKTGSLIRSSSSSKLNPYDLFALETALRLKTDNDTLTALTMGPMSAKEVLKEAIYMGLDQGILLSDRLFGGSDVLATSYALSKAIEKTGPYDIIITGKQTTDGDTAQVGAELASILNYSYVSNVIEIESRDNKLITKSKFENSLTINLVELPCIISSNSDINTPRLPSYKRKLQLCNNLNIITLSAKDLNLCDKDPIGLSGSATKVRRIFPPEINKERILFNDDSKLFSLLKEKKFI